MDLPYSPEVLAQRARDITRQLGYSTPPVDTAANFEYDGDYLQHLDHAGGEHPDWNKVLNGRPSVLNYWRRESPEYLIATQIKSSLLTPGLVTLDDPPPIVSGMAAVVLDPQGQLVRFSAVPPQKNSAASADQAGAASPAGSAPQTAQPYDWKQLFDLAGLNMSQFHPTTPIWNSLGASDARAAWLGVWPGTSEPLRVEAASWHGKPVFFRLISDWTEPDRMPSGNPGSKGPDVLLVAFLLVLLAGAIWLGRRNYLQKRSDPQGALKLGFLMFTLEMLVWLLGAHFVPSLGTFELFVLAASGAIFLSAVFYVVYLAIEPYVRKHWPHAIISWSRLMAGRIRDPLVGRDVLFGTILGISWGLIFEIGSLALRHISAEPNFVSTDFLFGPRRLLGSCLWHAAASVQATLAFFFLMFAFRVILRKPWLAAIAFVAFWTLIKSYSEHHLLYVVPMYAAVYGVAAFMVLRFGFVALAVGIFTVDLIGNLPVTTDLSAWYAGNALFILGLVAAMAIWGCYSALAGQKLVKENLFD